ISAEESWLRHHVQRQDLKRIESKAVWAPCGQGNRGLRGIFLPRAVGRVSAWRSRGQLECALEIDRYGLRPVTGVAQHKNSLASGPRGPAVYLQQSRVSANPVRVHQNVGVGA